MVGAWRARFGLERRNVGMTHDIFVSAPLIGLVARSFGAVRANPRAAREAIALGYDVTAFPGGNLDSCRPFTAPREVRFGGHRGYVRLALETGVLVVPVATIGSHWSYAILPGGETLARLVGLRRFSRDSLVPVTVGALLVGLAILVAVLGAASGWWVLAALVAALVPTPVRVTSRVLPAIDVNAETAHIADPSERIEHAHRLVHGALVDAVATMQHPK
jgi:1-acyl-sn-glycerol-3-phosphate acyltransferase